MISIILFFGLMVFLAGVIFLANPEAVFGILRNNLEKVSLKFLAVGIRAIWGIDLTGVN